jgi:hypothetical protein
MTGRFGAHELGHTFDSRLGRAGLRAIQSASIFTSSGTWVTGNHWVNGKIWERGTTGYKLLSAPYMYHGPEWRDWNQIYDEKGNYTGIGYQEEWADMFLNWSYGSFTPDEAGNARDSWMNSQISGMLMMGGK